MFLFAQLPSTAIRRNVRSRLCSVLAVLALFSTLGLFTVPASIAQSNASIAAREDPWAGVEEMLVTGDGSDGGHVGDGL